jgi:hypothetical protein
LTPSQSRRAFLAALGLTTLATACRAQAAPPPAPDSYGQQYLHRVVPDLNATGTLPGLLTVWGGSGLHGDVMMYRPTDVAGFNLPAHFTPRYRELRGNSLTPRLIQTILAHQAASAAAPS